MKKKTFTKKQSIAATIRRRQTPPSPPITINLQLEKKSKSFKPPPKEKKIVKLTQCTTLYSRLERITTSKSKKKLGDFGAIKQKISKNPETIYNQLIFKHNSELGFFCENTTSNCFDLCPACTSARPAYARAFPLRALLFSVSGGFLFSKL